MNAKSLFSRDEATLYEGVSVRPMVGWTDWSVTSYFFGLLGATNAVYTALLFSDILFKRFALSLELTFVGLLWPIRSFFRLAVFFYAKNIFR